MSASATTRDVNVSPERSCNCCDNCAVSCCFPLFGRRFQTSPPVDIRIVRTADEAIQKTIDSPKESPTTGLPALPPSSFLATRENRPETMAIKFQIPPRELD